MTSPIAFNLGTMLGGWTVALGSLFGVHFVQAAPTISVLACLFGLTLGVCMTMATSKATP